MSDVLIITGSYIFVVIFAFVIMNFATKGFLMPWIIARISRGKKLFIEEYGVNGIQYKTGRIEEEFVVYQAQGQKKKFNKKVEIGREFIIRKMGIETILIDGISGKAINPSFTATKDQDLEKSDNILVRALTGPQLQDKKENIILLLVIVSAVVSLIVLMKVIGIENALKTIKSLAGNV